MDANTSKLHSKSTWLEIIIGAVILLVISVMTAPYLTRAAGRERLEGLSDTLHLVRCTIDMYRANHDGLLPGQRKAGQFVLPADFVRDLTLPDTNGCFPYFQRFPENPFIRCDDSRSTVTCVNNPDIQPNGTEGTAWWFNAATGQFKACDSKFHAEY
jgi:type II secretory pathway pseudopilin PulG